HVAADGDGARPGNPAQVVAAEVDQHHVLRPLLRVALELLGEERVLRLVLAARRGARDGVGRQAVALDLEQELRARPDDLERRYPDEAQVRAGVDPAERAVEVDPGQRRVRAGTQREVERLAPGEDDLDRLARRDRVLRDLDSSLVLLA